MSRFLFVLITLALFFACTSAQEESLRTDAGSSEPNIRVVVRSSNSTDNLPDFTASLTEALLQPEDQFPQGTYNNRVFGCCSPRHLGHDFKAPAGTPVKALAPGVILPSPISGPHCNYGNVVAIWSRLLDGTEFVTVYGHLSGRATLAPKLSGNVHRDTVIGYVAHSGGTSPAGSRCGTDDENGDGAEHVHIAVRMGPPPVDANGNMLWAYYGYAGNGEDADSDANGTPHGGKFTSVKAFADCHGTHAGAKPDLNLVPNVSHHIARGYCDIGGHDMIGDSQNVGNGNGLSDWSGAWCQSFKRPNLSPATTIALCLDGTRTRSDTVLLPIWKVFVSFGAGARLGSPLETTRNVSNPDGLEQRFERGVISVRGNVNRVTLNDGSIYEQDGDMFTQVDPGHGFPIMSSSSSSSIASSTMSSRASSRDPASSSSSSFSSSSSSSSSSSTMSSRASSRDPAPEEIFPPYSTCGRFGFNIVVNGDFTLDPLACGWMLEDHLGTARVQQVITPGPDPKAIIGTSVASSPWSVQLKQYVPMMAGQRYLFHFRVKTHVSDRLIVQIMDDESPWANYGLWMDVVTPGGIEQEFRTTFHATRSHSAARLTFQMGQSTNSFTFDKVWLEAIVEDTP